MAEVAPDIQLYARVASGFRAPTIQGRDVAFFSPPSVATSEKIMSYEMGFKSELADRRVRLNGAIFHYRVDDPQFTAVGGAGNLVQLVNADEGRAWGFELDGAFRASREFPADRGRQLQRHRDQRRHAGRGHLRPVHGARSDRRDRRQPTRALVDGNPFPNAPDWIFDVTARWGMPVGNDGEIFVFTDWAYQGETNFFLYESREFVTDGQIEGGLRIGYGALDGRWEVALFGRNITDEDNVKGGIDFNNNTGVRERAAHHRHLGAVQPLDAATIRRVQTP